MQQPLVRVVLATVWLVVSVSVVAGTTGGPSYLTPDQYSPQASQWKDPEEDQTLLYLSIDPAASIGAESLQRIVHPKYIERSFIYPSPKQDGSSNNEFVSLREGKQSENSAESRLTDERTSQSDVKKQESFSHDVPPELQDSFVADDTFQDQGPGSVEIYKLDLYKEKSLLSPTPTTRTLIKNKSKIPKKTSDTNWKSKTSEYKTTSPKVLHRQSNFFDELQTDTPLHSDSFGTGGVPELQVGCEGLEASSHKLKRSINSPSKGRNPQPEAKPMFDATPISLDLEYELSSDETYEEMDELHRLKKLENTTKKPQKNRGDMDARLQDTELSDDKTRPEKLPVRGDLGSSTKSLGFEPPAFILNNQTGAKERAQRDESSNTAAGNLGRKLLWAEDLVAREKFANRRRSKRSYWGFEEDEGVVSSDELQTENQRRRQYYERQQLEGARRREQTENQTQTQIHGTREEYERLLEQRRREDEERRRRLQQDKRQRTMPDRRQEHDLRQQDYRSQQEEYTRQMQQRPRPTDHRRVQVVEPYYPSNDRNRSPTEVEQRPQRPRDEESKRRQQQQEQESERRRQEYEEARRRYQEEQNRRQVSADDDTRRRVEIERRRQETDARRPAVPNSDRYLSPEERRKLDERRREWMLKRQQHEEEEEKRRQQQQAGNQTPSNLQYPHRSASNGANRPSELSASESERRSRGQAERERERKLREYIQRNQPINVSRSSYRRREDFPQVRTLEDERRGLESRSRDPYRNATSRNTETENRERAEDPRRRYSVQRTADEEERRRGEEQRRRHEEYTRQMEEENRKRLEDQRQREEHTRYQEYSGRPPSVSNWTQGRKVAEDPYYSRPRVATEKHTHGPSAPVNGSPRNYMSWRLEEEQRKREEEMKKEILRREDEARRAQSRRYEEERRRQEAIRIEAERRRKELVEQQARRSQIGRAWPSETTKPEYGDHRPQEHRRRPDATFVPANLVLDESRRAAERDRQRQEQERRRLEAERRRQDEERQRQAKEQEDYDRVMKEQQRRQEEARLHALPVSARVIIAPRTSSSPATPIFRSRNGFDNDIEFSGINPNRQGVLVPKFPAPPTRSPPMKSPSPCVWAVVQCCPTNRNRLVTCFESVGCPGVNWDGNPCRGPVAQAARNEVAKFYAAAEMDEYS